MSPDHEKPPAGQFELELSGSSLPPEPPLVVADLTARFDRLSLIAERMADDVAHLRRELRYRRQHLNAATKRQHVWDIRRMGGRCPCCSSVDVVDAAGQRIAGSEFDHFFAVNRADPAHTWLICRSCHLGLTTGRVSRDQREAEFRAYQSKRRRLSSMTGRLS